jgi:hypothetical protein
LATLPDEFSQFILYYNSLMAKLIRPAGAEQGITGNYQGKCGAQAAVVHSVKTFAADNGKELPGF